MTDTEFTLLNQRFDSIEKLVNGINTRLDTLNGKVYSHETIIQEAIGERKQNRLAQEKSFVKVEELETRVGLVEKAEVTHVINCPQAVHIRALQDEALSNKSVKKFMAYMFVSGVGLGGLIIGMVELIIKLTA